MIVARRDMQSLDGKPVVAGQVLDGIWPTLRERTRRVLLRGHYVEQVEDGAEPEGPVSWANTERRDVDMVRVMEGDREVIEFVRVPRTDAPVRPKRGRPKGSKPKPAAQAKT